MELYDVKAQDFGPYQSFELPLYRQGLVWIGGANLDSQGASSNGSGKSHLFKAVGWALYGRSLDKAAGDPVIRNGASAARVDLRFYDSAKQLWTIRRERRRGTPKLSLLSPDGKSVKGSREELQQRILDSVGLDFRAFCNTVLYAQNDVTRFACPLTTDVERKDTLHRILRLELLADCHEHAKAQSAAITSVARQYRSDAEKVQARMSEHDLERLRTQSENWETERSRRVEAAKANVRRYRDRAHEWIEKSKVVPVQESVAEYRDRLDKLQELSKAVELKSKGIGDVASELRDATNERTRWLKCREKCLGFEANLERQLERLSGDRCPVCASSLKIGEGAIHIEQLKQQLEAQKRETKVASKEYERAGIGARVAEDKLKSASEAAETTRRLRAKITQVEELIVETERQNRVAQREIDAAKERAADCVERAKEALQRAREIAAEPNPYSSQIEETTKKLKRYQIEYKQALKQAKEAETELPYWQFWVRGFSNQGLPSYLLDSVMPYLTERANHYLNVLADGDITMVFKSQRELKSARDEYRDRIDIQWQIEGLEGGYPASGGQLKKMEIATDLALMDLVATREGARTDLLMFDEVLGGLDAEGRERVLRLLQALRAERQSIFVISHQTDLAEVFEKSWRVTKRGEVATLETGG